MSEARTAAVVGAGIGGLSAAIALESAGYETTVYEQADEIRPLGAGLSVWPNGVRALRVLGLDELVDNAEATIGTGSIRRADGSALARFDPDVVAKRWGEPLLGLHRAALHARYSRRSTRRGSSSAQRSRDWGPRTSSRSRATRCRRI